MVFNDLLKFVSVKIYWQDESRKVKQTNEHKCNRDEFVQEKCEDQSKCGFEQKSLVKITEMPAHLQFNPWIRNGYRPGQLSTMECIKSLTYFHNETVNILTHGVALLCFFVFFDHFDLPWQQINVPVLAYFHLVSCVTPWIGSTIYHTFMNHESGQSLYTCLLKWDVVGIWVTQSVGASTTIYTSVVSCPFWFQVLFIGLYVFLSLVALRASVSADNAWQRPASFANLFAMRIVGFVLRIYHQEYSGNRWINFQLVHVAMQEIWPIVGALISATRIPERFWPGYFDYFFNSHNIMHCFVIFGALHMHWATFNDLVWLSQKQ